MNGRNYTYVGLVKCELSSGDLYAIASRIAEAEVDRRLIRMTFWSEIERTHFSNCHMTNDHVIVGSSAHESQEN